MDRRDLLKFGIAGVGFAAAAPLLLAQTPGDRRLVFVILRGALDGLHAVPATGDPAFAGARGRLAEIEGIRRLDSTFGLHPAMAQIHAMYGLREALFVHAIASPYRERSHFDGQNVLESGASAPYRREDGWLNRLVALLGGTRAIAFAPTVPLAMQGPAQVSSFEPTSARQVDERLAARVAQLYDTDPLLHPMWQEAVEARRLAVTIERGRPVAATRAARIARIAAGFLAAPDGPRIAMIETNQWDTHTQQAGRLNQQLAELDQLVAGLKTDLGPIWNNTLVIAATEFGRTVAINGTNGTDHGTGSVAMIFGGRVAGGRVVADWPGLRPAQLFESRDLRPTIALDDMISGALAAHYRLPPERVAHALFPDRTGAAMGGLIRV